MGRVAVSPDLLRWARERSGKDPEGLRQRFPKLSEWESQEMSPTLKQLEAYAKATYTPLGYLFLKQPPEDRLPIPFFRTGNAQHGRAPSLNLLDTIQAMQRRQDWLRESLAQAGEPILDFVGSARIEEPARGVATRMRESLGLERNWAQTQQTWTAALETLRNAIDAVGVVVVTNGVVGNNTHRKLDPGEFRGFVLVDQHAPLVFVNGADPKAAQMFTLVHELAHLWFGQSAVFDLQELRPSADRTETACNSVAAEFLVAEEELRAAWARVQNQGDPFNVLARQFKVSAIVAARRALDLQFIPLTDFLTFFRDHLAETPRRKKTKPDGGDFYRTQNVRLGRRFAVALVHAVEEGRLAYREAYALTGLWGQTFDKYFASLQRQRRT